jgi:hypothetical protein
MAFNANFNRAAARAERALIIEENEAARALSRAQRRYRQDYVGARAEVERARKEVRRLEKVRQSRGVVSLTARQRVLAAEVVRDRRHYAEPVRATAAENAPTFAIELQESLDTSVVYWPPNDAAPRRVRAPWARSTPPPHVYSRDPRDQFPAFSVGNLWRIFTEFQRDIIYSPPDAGLRYSVKFGDNFSRFVVDARHNVFVLEALIVLLMSTYQDIRGLFNRRTEFAVMFRVIGDLYEPSMSFVIREDIAISMPTVNLRAYFNAMLNPDATIRNDETQLREYLSGLNVFDSLFENIDAILNNLESHRERVGSTTYFMLTGIEFLMFPINPLARSGSCARRSARRVLENGILINDVASTQNNCFFAAVLPAIQIKYSVKTAREERNLIGIPPKVPVTLQHIILWSLQRNAHVIVYGLDREILLDTGIHLETTDVTIAGAPINIQLLLHGGHYSRIHALFKDTIKCSACNTAYIWNHECNVLKANYYQRKIKERPFVKRRKITEDPLNYHDVLGFDIEALVDPTTHRLESYAVGYGWANAVNDIEYTWGKRSLDSFVDYVLFTKPRYVIGFNLRMFDGHFLLRVLHERGISIKNLIMDGSKILSADISYEHSIIKLWDLFNFVPSSLSAAAKAFGLDVSKGLFPHKLMSWERLEYVGPWPDNALNYFFEKDHPEANKWLKSDECSPILNVKELCLSYLKKDVQCLLKLFVAVNDSYRLMYDTNVTRFVTASQAGFSLMVNSLPSNIFLEIPESKELASFLRAGYYGGITQAYRQHVTGVHETIMDVNGLYPYVMANKDLPHGLSRWMTSDELELCETNNGHVHNKLYLLECDYVPPTDIFIPVLPHRSMEGLLRYTCEPGHGVHASVKIQLAIELGYKIKPIRGVIWDEASNYMSDIMIKHQTNRAEAQRTGNVVAASMAKTGANSTYGQTGMRPRLKVTKPCDTMEDVRAFINKYKWTDFAAVGSKCVYLIGEKPLNQESSGETKPVQVAIFVTAHAQIVLLRAMMIIDPTGLRDPNAPIYYADTDSIHTNRNGEQLLIEAGLVGKLPGQFSNDLTKSIYNDPNKPDNEVIVDAFITEAIYVRPKLYFLNISFIYRDGSIKIRNELASKGVPHYSWLKRDDNDNWLNDPSFFYNVIARKRDSANIETRKGFDSLKASGISKTSQSFSHYQSHMSRKIQDGWTGRVLDHDTSIFYPIGYNM